MKNNSNVGNHILDWLNQIVKDVCYLCSMGIFITVFFQASVALAEDELAILETQCGPTWDVQDVEQYDGTLGVSQSWVDERENPVGYHVDMGCSGTLISEDLFLSAGHCGYQVNHTVRFNYQNDKLGNPKSTQDYSVVEVVEQENNSNWDYAIVRLEGKPGKKFGFAQIIDRDPITGSPVTLIGHPSGVPKVIHSADVVGNQSNWLQYTVDTAGGSSGSGVLTSDGYLVGVHTNGGCNTTNPIGSNSGMRISRILDHSYTLQKLIHLSVLSAPRDFDGDGAIDIMKIWKNGSRMYSDVHLSTGDQFGMHRWASGQGGMWANMQWFPGDFDGDGQTDLMKIWKSGGRMYSDVHLSTGDQFEMHRWASGQGGMWDQMLWF